MADSSDIETALAQAAAAALYPNGVDAPSVAGVDCLTFRGWPGETKINNAIVANKIIVSVYGKPGETPLTNFEAKWKEAPGNLKPTLQAVQEGWGITFSGDCSRLPINIAVTARHFVMSYAALATDTPASIAHAFVVRIPGASAEGPLLTVPYLDSVGIGSNGDCIRELRRQERHFQVTVWSPTPLERDLAAKAIDAYMALTLRLALFDQTGAYVRYIGSLSDDATQKAGVFRRDLLYSVNYATVETRKFTDVVNFGLQLDNGHETRLLNRV